MRSIPRPLSLVAALALLTSGAKAQERWLLNGAGSAAAPLDDAHRETFEAGPIGEIGAYHSLIPQVLIGARLSGGVLLGDDDVNGTIRDRNDMEFGAVSGALRLRPLARPHDPRRGTGLWLEGAGGPGLVDGELRAVLSPGLGYVFDAGGLGIGPVLRYLHVFEGSERFGGNDARIASLGVELVFLDARRRGVERETPGGGEYRPEVAPPAPLEPAALVTPAPPKPADRVEFVEDRLVLGNELVFGFDSATLEPIGRQKLDDVIAIYKADGEKWKTLKVEGNTDSRGSDEHNQELSRRRAEAVANYLESYGIPESMIQIEPMGETNPFVPNASTEAEHRQNRRVELVIVRQ